ncbi:beta-lactamase superfamily domain-containing protein [Paenibacillus sp. 32O-W]|uniref:MBL fold metallo-hydrolase n=1 Tax=Paenibacillus sp. 32O-W TaxID=1695218 RepID=UPI00071EBB4F|nr:MBL fold metallo-hydrolase [Paenibacillus sp. 32O-W]ALS26372.1 beta-lactamase superfamily domain-containing protein [Paenibacillus sp. 32O-W]
MKLTFLGTGAAEGIPSPFCDCATCDHARVNGGRNVRKRQSVLVNDDLLIDLGPDLFASCAQLGLSLCGVKTLLVTHSHMDHFDPNNLLLRTKPFRLATELPEMAMIAGPSVWTRWDGHGGSDKQADIRRTTIVPGRSREVGAYTIRAIEACHHLRVGDAMNYVIGDGKSMLLYASDSGLYEGHVWKELEGTRFDGVVMEGTIWKHPSGREHLNEGDFRLMLNRLRGIGAIDDRTVVIATHFSHQGVGPHEEIAESVKCAGAICAYDGFVVSIGE